MVRYSNVSPVRTPLGLRSLGESLVRGLNRTNPGQSSPVHWVERGTPRSWCRVLCRRTCRRTSPVHQETTGTLGAHRETRDGEPNPVRSGVPRSFDRCRVWTQKVPSPPLQGRSTLSVVLRDRFSPLRTRVLPVLVPTRGTSEVGSVIVHCGTQLADRQTDRRDPVSSLD